MSKQQVLARRRPSWQARRRPSMWQMLVWQPSSPEDVPAKMFSNGVPDDVPATGLRQGCDAEQGCDRVATAPERTTIPSNAPSSSRGAFSRHIHQPVVFPTMFPTAFPATYPVGACA